VGIHVEKLERTDITAIQVVNNTFYKITHQGILIEGPSSGSVQNNVFFDVGGDEESYVALGVDSKGMAIGYNSHGMSNGRAPGKLGSRAPYPHDLWRVDPKFVSAATKDFRLLPNSPLVDAAVTLNDVTVDILGVPRPQGAGYDIGAYEFKP
jgi:hypothetical protein